MEGVRLVDIKGPDVKIQGEKFTCRATQECDIVTNGFMKMESAFKIDAQKADEAFGAMSKVLEESTTLNVPQIGEKLKSIEDKVNTKSIEGGEISGAIDNVQDTLSGLLGGLG